MLSSYYKHQPGRKQSPFSPRETKNYQKDRSYPQKGNLQESFQKIIKFETNKYPFPNNLLQSNCLMRKTFLFDIAQVKQVQESLKINHQNLILTKIIQQNTLKDLSSRQKQYFFSVLYESVPFSIKNIGLGHQGNKMLMKMMKKIHFGEILKSLTVFFMKKGIYHLVRLGDIGVTADGKIKIFVSPQIISGVQKGKSDIKQVLKNNEKLVSWWETTFNCSQTSNESSKNTSIRKSLENIECIKCQSDSNSSSQKVKKLTKGNRIRLMGSLSNQRKDLNRDRIKQKSPHLSTTLMDSCKSFQSQMSKINIMQKQKMTKICQDIKVIKRRLQAKKSAKLIKKSEIIKQRYNEQNEKKLQQTYGFFEYERYKMNNPQDSYIVEQQNRTNQESIQQNINCINIYNQPSGRLKYFDESIKRLSSQPVLSFSIIPSSNEDCQTLTSQPNFVMKQNDPYFDCPFDQIEDQVSLDTYDIELNLREQESVHQNKFPSRQTFISLDREISERNHKCRRNNIKEEALKVNSGKNNQVENRTFSTESAGPAQFKNFINKYIKPQFLAKQSNIYEDQLEYESQASTLKQQKFTNDLDNHCRGIISGVHQSKNSEQKVKNIFKTQLGQKDEHYVAIPRMLSDKNISLLENMRDLKRTYIESDPISNDIISNVQGVLQRTKNALQILNRAKNDRIPDWRVKYATTIGYQ